MFTFKKFKTHEVGGYTLIAAEDIPGFAKKAVRFMATVMICWSLIGCISP